MKGEDNVDDFLADELRQATPPPQVPGEGIHEIRRSEKQKNPKEIYSRIAPER